jgi:hypothetical protein
MSGLFPATSAFDSTDGFVIHTLEHMRPVSRSVLTFLHVDPALARQSERDRLRTLVKLTAADPDNQLIGRAYQDLRALWQRGFPVPAFDDASRGLLPEGDAHRLVKGLRETLHTRWDNEEWERVHVERLMRLLGYEPSPLVATGVTP